MKISNLKIDVKNEHLSDESSASITQGSSLFFYGNGDINWYATDFLMSDAIPNSSKKTAKGLIRYFLEYLECYENWKCGDIQGRPTPIGLTTDALLYDYVEYIEDDIGLNRNAIANRVRIALRFLEFVQKNYCLDYQLISIANAGTERLEKGLVNAEYNVTPYRNKKYIHHDCIPHSESYGSRAPITEAAIESLYDDLDTLANEGQLYCSEFFSTLINLLETTGIRVSEATNIDTHTIELLREQVKSSLNGKSIEPDDLIRLNMLTANTNSLKAAEAIYRKSVMSSESEQLVWIKIKTTKGKNKNTFRIIPISFITAQNLIRFYDDYILNETDRVNTGLNKVNRANFGKLFVHPNSHLPMTGSMISSLFYEVFSRRFKSKHKRTPHLFRHRYITLLTLQQLKSLKSNIGGTQLANLILKRIQGLTGHASIETMLHYVELAEADLYESTTSPADEVFDSITRQYLVDKFGEKHVSEMESELKMKKARQALVNDISL
ncbi:site-specific integrase [Vibrio brasiliensis]|uniref:site-specific integrase n=1 Tax=Vibrio brasiliensis TaxID=170652 RepID=UPI001EFDE84E|nr:site-specific integrase [Vibrio brasiliensis]MCG9727877.1 site-specific integrase [Vibrio brasiliensis]